MIEFKIYPLANFIFTGFLLTLLWNFSRGIMNIQKTDKQSFAGYIEWKTLGKIGEELCSDSLSPELKTFKAEIDTLAKNGLPDDYLFRFNKIDNLRRDKTFITSLISGDEKKGNKHLSDFFDDYFLETRRTKEEILNHIKISVQMEINRLKN